MVIHPDLITTWGGKTKIFKKNDFIFMEDEEPKWFFQILRGKVRMFNSNEDGREFTQGHFQDGDSFGEPPLLILRPYPTTAQTMEDSVIQMLDKEVFFQILEEYPEIKTSLLQQMATRVYDKAMVSRSIVNCKPENRVLALLERHKERLAPLRDKSLISLTRQEIANHTGLRVETVIRTINKLAKRKTLEIRDHKIYF
ncbi:MAG TPA: Crp/Fnr family transcriptional regulator [Catalimonadaceae bacterium]|nr:Crp/Fnr family transcriptional regulator [Catalimonadaceae bacterium]HPI10270.1 Crp/Fnr family transcriptional regulator [Catalimonadaceae bacterium]